MENENKFQTTTTVAPVIDTNAVVQEVVVGVLSGLALVAGLGFMVFMVGRAVIEDAETRGKYQGKDEARVAAEAEAERAEARHAKDMAYEREMLKAEIEDAKAEAKRLERELDALRDA